MEENKKQTAVEWFSVKDGELTIQYLKGEINGIQLAIEKTRCFDKAIAMEKDIQEHDIRFAYMAGFNRGLDNNPNHLEEYIKYIKSI